MKHYKETQKGGVIGITLTFAIVAILLAFVFKAGKQEISTLSFFVLALTFMAVYLLFAKLKTSVLDDNIELKFGVGVIKKNIPLSTISKAEVVRNKWYYGWGIRYYGKGWMWNFTGLDAVEIHFKNKKSTFRIGTKKAEKLKNAIEALINS